jgi:uncharacterized membrane protein YeaQ/YmgE (transglycosylase-associated protein family)
MDLEQILIVLFIGAIAGWIAGLIIKGGGFGIVGNIIIGILGAIFGSWLFDALDISIGGEWLGPIVTATAGAVLLLIILGFVRKK